MEPIKFIIIGILILFFIVLLTKRWNYGMQPKIIWTYWDNPDKLPKTVKICMESWKRYNPEYEIILLTKGNYKKYVTIAEDIASNKNFNDSSARFSDLLRLCVLAEHGGVWIDSSILLKEPFDNWLFPRPAEFSGFYIESFTKKGLPPVIESWFLACNKNSTFMGLWRDEFLKMAEFPSFREYVFSRRDIGVDYEQIGSPGYLTIHIAAQKILQVDKYPLDSLILRRAEDGPYRYLAENEWDSERALKFACKNKKYQGPIMKMRRDERTFLDQKIDSDFSLEKCGWLD